MRQKSGVICRALSFTTEPVPVPAVIVAVFGEERSGGVDSVAEVEENIVIREWKVPIYLIRPGALCEAVLVEVVGTQM